MASEPVIHIGCVTSPSIAALAAALAKAQGEMGVAVKDASNPFFKSKYADLASVSEACRGPLSKNELAFLQPLSASGAHVTVTTILAHSSGEWISQALTITAKDESAQSIGSAATYGRRYGLMSMVGIAPDDDDDGNAASGKSIARDEHDQRRPETESPRPQPEQRAVDNGHGSDLVISEAQAKRFYAISMNAGWREPDLKTWLKETWGFDSSKAITRKKYDEICKAAVAAMEAPF